MCVSDIPNRLGTVAELPVLFYSSAATFVLGVVTCSWLLQEVMISQAVEVRPPFLYQKRTVICGFAVFLVGFHHMLMIRFQRIGRTNDPAFRIVVLEKERAAKSGRILELLGTYNPRSKALTLNEEAVKHWIGKGAQPTDSIHNLLITKGVIQGKKINVLPKKSPPKKEGEDSPVAVTPTPAAPAEAETVESPTEEEVAAEAEPAAPVQAEALPTPETETPSASVEAATEGTPDTSSTTAQATEDTPAA
jgi:small subunit ribosomal protein S16